MRRIILILAAAVTLVIVDTADATRGSGKVPIPCKLPARSHMIIANSQAMIYELEYPEIRACAYRNRRSYALGSAPAFASTGGTGVFEETLADAIVAYEYHSSPGPTSENMAYWHVVVRNLQTGRVLHNVPTGISNHAEPGFSGVGPTKAIVLKSDGAVAWIVQTHLESPSANNNYKSHGEYAVEAADKTGNRLLASGPGIDPSSLALAGSTLYWTQEGKPASAVLN